MSCYLGLVPGEPLEHEAGDARARPEREELLELVLGEGAPCGVDNRLVDVARARAEEDRRGLV